MSGINKHPIPAGKVSVEPNGHVAVVAANGHEYNLRPNGTVASIHTHAGTAVFRGDGHIASVHTPTLRVMHGPHGERTIIRTLPDHRVVVSTGRHFGYVQRNVPFHGTEFVQRTYVHGAGVQTAIFTNYSYRGVALVHYVPTYTYSPAFYGWAYYGWDRPIPYAWAWAGDPWVPYYMGYWSPLQAYASGAMWLADYYLSSTLADAYLQDDPGAPGDDMADDSGQQDDGALYAQQDTPISPDVRQAIADEVQQQISYENAAVQQPAQATTLTDLPQILEAGHIFVVSEPLSVQTTDQQNCALSAGNVIRLEAPPAEGSPAANLTVVSSRKADCPAGLTVTLALEDLQEMQNSFRAKLDAGLQTLHDRQGQGGLPAAPNSAMAMPPIPAPMPPADNESVQAALLAEQRSASATENQLTETAFSAQP